MEGFGFLDAKIISSYGAIFDFEGDWKLIFEKNNVEVQWKISMPGFMYCVLLSKRFYFMENLGNI